MMTSVLPDSASRIQTRQETRKLNDLVVSDTVSVLESSTGSTLVLVGTAHFSEESNKEVARLIEDVQPDAVILELCQSRTAILVENEEQLLEKAQNISFANIQMMAQHMGMRQALLKTVLLQMSASITKQLGMAPGGEFRAAYNSALANVHGCQVVLGDRPIETTLKRLMNSLSGWQKCKAVLHAVAGLLFGKITPEDIEKLKKKDMLEEVLSELAEGFPGVSEILVTERDIYLAYMMLNIAKNIQIRNNYPIRKPVIVGVVGLGHTVGIKKFWNEGVSQDEARRVSLVTPTAKFKNRSVFQPSPLKIGALGIFCIAAFSAFKYWKRR